MYKPSRTLLVIMIRGIFQRWKTPVYIDVDTNVTKPLVDDVINKLERSGLKVRACTFDLGKKN